MSELRIEANRMGVFIHGQGEIGVPEAARSVFRERNEQLGEIYRRILEHPDREELLDRLGGLLTEVSEDIDEAISDLEGK
jgi:hypothetical protein